MNAYASGHAFIMWGFYALGCVFIGLLGLLAFAWCYDRWMSRKARRAAKELQAQRTVRHEVTFNPELFL